MENTEKGLSTLLDLKPAESNGYFLGWEGAAWNYSSAICHLDCGFAQMQNMLCSSSSINLFGGNMLRSDPNVYIKVGKRYLHH